MSRAAEQQAQAYAAGYSEGLKYALGADAYEAIEALRADQIRLTAKVERLQALLRSAQGMMAELGVEDAYDLLWSSIGAALAREDGA